MTNDVNDAISGDGVQCIADLHLEYSLIHAHKHKQKNVVVRCASIQNRND